MARTAVGNNNRCPRILTAIGQLVLQRSLGSLSTATCVLGAAKERIGDKTSLELTAAIRNFSNPDVRPILYTVFTLLGYFSALAIGLLLGLIGAGGSILSVPAFVYLFSIKPLKATVYSLFVVGFTALVGAASYWKGGYLRWRVALLFASPAIVGIYVARKILLPALPEVVFHLGDKPMTRDSVILLVFAVTMMAAAVTMLRNNPQMAEVKSNSPTKGRILLIPIQGLLVGTVTGFVGAGGGFLIIPGLVILVGLPMKEAVGTSLFIVAINSLLGFLIGAAELPHIEWHLLVPFLGLAIAGNFLGTWLSQKISAGTLRVGFGWFIVAMAIYIFAMELLGKRTEL